MSDDLRAMGDAFMAALRPERSRDVDCSLVIARIRQRQSMFRLSFDDRRVTRAMLRAQAEEFERWLADVDPFRGFVVSPKPRTDAGWDLFHSMDDQDWLDLPASTRHEAIRAVEVEAARLDVERLRAAIYTVSVRHDWANTTDTEDRTEEIAAEYAAPSKRAALSGRRTR